MPRKPPQQDFTFITHGGKRAGAGRKPRTPGRPGVTHLRRPSLSRHHPAHVTLHVRPDVPNLRRNRTYPLLRAALRAGRDRFGFRLCHFVVLGNHLHLIVEAADARALARGLQGLSIRLARAANRATARRGRVFADRYHARQLRTPREVHRALAYVLLNARRHAAEIAHHHAPAGPDACSSAAHFDGWRQSIQPPTGPPPVAPPTTWLLTRGWRRHGLLSLAGLPGS